LKRNSLFIIYGLTIALSIFLFTPSHISTDMLDIFKKDKNIERLKIINSFESSSILLVAIKGFTKENRNRLLSIEKRLKVLPYIKETKLSLSRIEVSDYLKKNYYLLSKFTPIPIDKKNVHKKLDTLKRSLTESFIYQPIDINDPLGLFKINILSQETSNREGYLSLGEYGYLIAAQVDGRMSDMEGAKKIESGLAELFKNEKDILVFSSLFFTAQNSTIIKKSVHTILYLSFALLAILFFVTLRDYRILMASIITLSSSVFVALSISTVIFNELSIFALAFGSALSSISVDYLFHNYFHGQYKKKGINKPVLIAFLTTVLGFTLLQFVLFPLIAQLSVFALISLSFSYFQFTFIYPYLRLSPKPKRLNLNLLLNVQTILPIKAVFIVSLIIIFYAGATITFDYNLKNLDYNNKELTAKQSIIQNNMPQKSTILIEANSVDNLIDKSYRLQQHISSTNAISKLVLSNKQFKEKIEKIKNYDFKKLKKLLNTSAKDLGFIDDYFLSSYTFISNMPSKREITLEEFKSLGYEVLIKNDKFYTIATIDKSDTINMQLNPGVYLINTSAMIKDTIMKIFHNLLLYVLLAFVGIVSIIAFILREKTIFALNYILFPSAIILLYLSFLSINIMHLFSMVIVVVAGIDYGIYMSQTNSSKTKEAIFYSLLTTFSGFGILVLSNIGAIHSIGVVVTIGVLSILFLILFLNKFTYNTTKDL